MSPSTPHPPRSRGLEAPRRVALPGYHPHQVERIGLAVGDGSFRARHRLTDVTAGAADDDPATRLTRKKGNKSLPCPSPGGRTSVSWEAELANLGAADAEPATLVPVCTRALDAALEA